MSDPEMINFITSSISIINADEDDRLVWRIVDLIKETGGFAFVGLYFVESGRNFAVIKAGTHPYGEILFQRKHKVQISPENGSFSPVSYAIWHNQLSFYDCHKPSQVSYSPLLPDTQWELAVPLRANYQVIGALEIDGGQGTMFSIENVAGIQTIADEVSRLLVKRKLV